MSTQTHRHPFPSSPNLRPCHGFSVWEVLVVIAVIALVVALSIPGFQKVKLASQEQEIAQNLGLLAEASQQYFLETGRESVSLETLVGPENPIPELESVAGEQYPEVIQSEEGEITASGGAPGDVTYRF